MPIFLNNILSKLKDDTALIPNIFKDPYCLDNHDIEYINEYKSIEKLINTMQKEIEKNGNCLLINSV